MVPLYYDHGQSPYIPLDKHQPRSTRYSWTKQPMAADKVPSVRMELQNTPFTVQLGRGASIQLANAVINTGNSEATIRFGSLEFLVATAMATAVPIHGRTVQGHSARPNSAETYARRAYSVQQPRAARTATAKVVQQNRTSVFERLSHPEVSTVKKTNIKQKTLPILSRVITLPNEPFVPGRHDHEASSSGGRLSRRQRRKLNAELRAQQSLPVHPSTLPALEPEANVPTQNKFTNLKWVKRNSSTGELKQSFWEQQQQTPAPQKKKYETLSARVHRVLKVARENGLMKKKYQKPFINKTARIPQRELPAARVTQEKLKSTPRGEHWSMKPELRIQESADKRSRWKGKEIWRPRLPERKLVEKNVRIGVTSGIASQRSASKKNRQQWVPKEKVPIINTYNSRHFGESSKESYCQPTSSYQKKNNVDHTPPIEEVPVPHAEPEIYWKRRSEIRVQENDEEEDTMEVEVVYMVGHGDEPHQTRGYKRRNEPGPASSKTTTSQEDQIQYEQLEGEEVPSGDEQNDDQEEEVLAETLAQAQRRLKFQMKEKDKEISELNSKMTEMMAQMTAMMQLMQKNIITNPALVQPADHHSSIPTNLPTNPVPQVSGIRTAHEEENEADRLDHLQTHQKVASASEPELLDRVAKFEKLNLSKSEYHSDRPRRNKAVDTRRDEVYSASSLRIDKEKQSTPKDSKEKQYTNPRPQPKLMLGGNDKSQTFRDGGERSKLRTGDRITSLKEKMNREYSFKRESVAKLFKQALNAGLELPECKRPEEADQNDNPSYCPYHRVISHPIEDCYVFKDWLEKKYRDGEFTLSNSVLVHPKKESVKVITSSPILPINEEDKSKGKIMSGKDEWQTAISKKTMKMIKQLEGVPGIKWKSSIEPVLELKENQNSGASTSRSLSWRRPKTKRFYKTSSKKSGNPNKRSKLKEKRTVLQKIINNLEDYHQPMRRPITLADFMSKLQIDPSEVEEDEQEDEELLHVETCRVISVASTAYQRDSIKDHDMSYITISPTKMTDKITSESCLMVVQTDDNSEEELCFPSDDESDQQIASQMERAKLNEDSKHTTKTSSDEVESNEVDQVQLRSARQNDHLYTYFITWWEEVRRGACDETGDPKVSFSVFATDRRTTYTRSRSTVGGSPVRRLRRERDIHKYPLAGKRLRPFQTVRTWHVSSSRWFRRQMAPHLQFCRQMAPMDKQDTPITVHLGRGARIQLANTVINTGSTGATIQFGSVDFSAITARTTVPRAHLPAPQITARDIPQGRISVFERLSQPETLTAKRVVDGRKVSVVTADTTALPRETVTSGIYDAEASSSGGKLNRRQRRKRNAELRAQQLSMPVHPSNIPAQELEATIPTQNGFSNLKWVKRNSSTGELKKSFWEQRREVPTPPKKKEPESLSARVYRVLRTVKEKGLTKKRFQRPLTADVRRTPPRERLSFARVERRERRNNPLGEHRGVTPELHIRGSTTERSRWKGKQVWRPRPRRDDERKEREIDLGVTSGAASRRSASTNKQRQKWVQKKTHDDTCPDSRHLGKFSKGSRRSLTPPKKEVNFDRSPRVEEILIPNQEPEIHWRRRSEVQVQEEEYDDEDTMDVELVYMVSHIDDNDSDDEEDRRSQTREQARRRRRGARSVTSQSVRSSEEEGEEVEENPFAEETLTLAQMRRQMRRQMKEKDKEISHLNEKMTEMMTQMTTMMEMMQKATSVGPTPAQPINHAASIAPAKPPDPHVPQASGIKGTPEGGNEAVDNTRQRTLQNVASASEPLEGVPGVKWKSPTEPVLNLERLPVPHASTSKQQPGQTSSSKSDKKKSKSAKKKAKIKKPKEKKTATQRVIDSLSEYHQTVRRPIKLEISDREKYAEEAAPEFCLMVSSMDYSSEEDLYFPKEDDTDPDIASQMEQVNLEDNSESTGESPDATMADSEENTASNKSESDEVAQLKSSSSLEAKASTSRTEKRPKQEGEMRQRGRKRVTPTLPKAVATPKTKRVVPHLGSDTEEDEVIPIKAKKSCQPTAKRKKKTEDSDPDYDYESSYANSVQGIFSRRIDSLSVSDSILVVTRIPLQHFKEVIPREVHNVEELVTFYVRPYKEKGGPGRLFYSVGKLNEEENRDWYRRIIDSGELLPTRLPRFNTKGIRRMLRKQINIPTSKRQLCFCLSIWYGRHPRPLRQKDAAARRVNSVWGAHFLHSSSLKPEWAYEVGLIKPRCGRVAGSSVYSTSHKKDRSSGTPFQQMDDEELSNPSSFSLTNSSKPD
ncbi:hypothetical protein M5K25_005106 [Dendrobium thyrsiflorum]|uniref:Uncharacterized protein n=1 Tax=Dendrobium thyrsiflorum TaxID=117978 RepID=A0ABD0VNY1_DENTH